MTPTPEQSAEWYRLRTTPTNLLTFIDQQRAFLLKQAQRSPPCPHCHTPLSEIDAAPDGWKLEEANTNVQFTCCHCGKPVAFILPLFAGQGWYWFTVAQP